MCSSCSAKNRFMGDIADMLDEESSVDDCRVERGESDALDNGPDGHGQALAAESEYFSSKFGRLRN